MVLELDGENAQVEFWDSTNVSVPQRFLDLLPSDSPEALLWEQPDQLASWATEKPLNLVASALSISGKMGKVADIREKLDGRVPLGSTWDNWWKKRTKALGSLPEHFGVVKANKGNEYELLVSIDVVPPDWTPPPKPKVVTTADWKKWLNAKTHEPPPGRFPTKPVTDDLAKWPAKGIEHTLNRVISYAQEFSGQEDTSAQAAEGWLRAVAQVSLRWREVADPDARGRQAARVGELLARLSRIAGERTPQDLLLQAGALDGQQEAWCRGFLAGLWYAFGDEDAREMYVVSSAILGRQARQALAGELFLAAFDPNFSDQRQTELDRLLDALPEDQRSQLLQEAVASANPDQRAAVLGYIANSRHAAKSKNRAQRLNLLTLAAILLSDGQGEVAAQASRELADAFAAPEEYGPAAQALFQDTRDRIAEERARIEGQMEERRKAHEAELDSERHEKEQWKQQVRERNAELAASREVSRLESRRDMLLAIGEILQSIRHRDSLEEVIGNVEAGLRLALRAGGAELLDSAPDGYDPYLHHASENLLGSSPVKVIAPGVIVRGKTHGDLVLLKAHVKHEAA